VVHLPPLPGAPLGDRPLEEVLAAALRDARALAEGGADGLIVENLGDRPYAADRVDAWTVAAMTRIAVALREALPDHALGVNVLRNDAEAAMSVAAAAAADFIRVNVHTGVMVADQGVLTGAARDTLLLRRRIGARVGIAADVAVKHAAPLAAQPLAQVAEDTFRRGLADALLVTGSGTGHPLDPADVDAVRAAVPEAPLWAASGVTPATLPALLERVDALVVGTWLHRDARLDAPVDPERVRALRALVPRGA
jgi:membrane complex biogenesis BtpA family protein